MDYLTIGTTKIEKTAGLAPMAGMADTAYRLMAKKFGASVVFSEMVSCKGLCYTDRKSAELLKIQNAERPMAVQLFGSEPEFFQKAAPIAAQYDPFMIDINCGCPVPKVTGTGAGSALMKNPKRIGEIIKSVKKATDIPVSIKIRSGWDKSSINAVETAKIAEDSGASAISVHGRTKDQMYSGRSAWNIIAEVKSAVSIPVFGSGDVTDALSCKKMYDETNCDFVLIGRGTYGKPWIFEEIKHYFETGELLPEKTFDEKLHILTEHIKLIISLKGEASGMREARKHAIWYLKGIPNAAAYRNLCGSLSTFDNFNRLVEEIRKNSGS